MHVICEERRRMEGGRGARKNLYIYRALVSSDSLWKGSTPEWSPRSRSHPVQIIPQQVVPLNTLSRKPWKIARFYYRKVWHRNTRRHTTRNFRFASHCLRGNSYAFPTPKKISEENKIGSGMLQMMFVFGVRREGGERDFRFPFPFGRPGGFSDTVIVRQGKPYFSAAPRKPKHAPTTPFGCVGAAAQVFPRFPPCSS